MRWQALQAALKISRENLDNGNHEAALQSVERALAIDPDFLAAQSLRDRIVSLSPAAFASTAPPVVQPAPAIVAPTVLAPPIVDPPRPETAFDAAPPETVFDTAPLAPPAPPVPSDGYAQLEQCAKRRRVDRRFEAARAAIALGRVKEAAAALEEIAALDANSPDLPELTLQVKALRRAPRPPSHRGQWLAAAAVFGGIVLGASWLHESGALWSRSLVTVGRLVVPPEPFAVTVAASEVALEIEQPETIESVATTGAAEPATFEAPRRSATPAVADAVVRNTPAPIPAASPTERRVSELAAPPPAVQAVATSTPPTQRPVPDGGPIAPVGAATVPSPIPPPSAPAASAAPAPVVNTAAAAAVPTVPTVDDEALVKQVLQRYRTAYEGLDARSARAVWPAVNEDALSRAFNALQSQTLTFEACDVRLRGDAAAATCRGSARYVPKVGSHEPRTEPRTWTFALRKNGPDWKIESARADR